MLKAVSDDIAHKTELGLVAVGLKNDEELARACAQMSERLARLDPPPSDRAFLVQEFVADGVELFAGVSRDPDFGLSLAVGMGGTAEIGIARDAGEELDPDFGLIPISACRSLSAWAAPPSKSPATLRCACCRCARATPRR